MRLRRLILTKLWDKMLILRYGGDRLGEWFQSYCKRMELETLLKQWDTQHNLPLTPIRFPMVASAKSGGGVRRGTSGRRRYIPGLATEPDAQSVLVRWLGRVRTIWLHFFLNWHINGIRHEMVASLQRRFYLEVIEWPGGSVKKATSGEHRSNPAWLAAAVRCVPTGRSVPQKTVWQHNIPSLPPSGTLPKTGRFHPIL